MLKLTAKSEVAPGGLIGLDTRTEEAPPNDSACWTGRAWAASCAGTAVDCDRYCRGIDGRSCGLQPGGYRRPSKRLSEAFRNH
jgi:hypothetical protein